MGINVLIERFIALPDMPQKVRENGVVLGYPPALQQNITSLIYCLLLEYHIIDI